MADLSLIDILKISNKTLTVKELFSNSKYNKDVSSEKVEAFYLELKEILTCENVIIEEVRDNGVKTGDVITYRG